MRGVLRVGALIGAALLVAGAAFAQTADFTIPDGWTVSTANKSKPGEAGYRIEHKDSGLELVYVLPGKSKMGTLKGRPDEMPVFDAEVAGFWIGRTEVTVGQWRKVMGKVAWPPANTEGDNHPIVMVMWNECKAFCDKLGLRLPGEIEWEYAARGPENRVYPWGNDFDARALLWPMTRFMFGDSHTAPVGSFPKGISWCGALDMAGNVREWCADLYDPDVCQRYATGDLKPPEYGSRRVVRGGSWFGGNERVFRGYARAFRAPEDRTDDLGFRIAKSVAATPADAPAP